MGGSVKRKRAAGKPAARIKSKTISEGRERISSGAALRRHALDGGVLR